MDTRRIIVAGLIASIVMGMFEMIYEALAGAGFWAPMVFIGATILRGLQSVQVPVPFVFWGVLFGLAGHMMNSVALGLIFARLAGRTAWSRRSLVLGRAGYAIVIFIAMWYVVLPAIDPVMLKLNGLVFAIAHVMWGATVGWLVPEVAGEVPQLRPA